PQKRASNFNTSQKAKPDQSKKTDKNKKLTNKNVRQKFIPATKIQKMWHKKNPSHTIEFSKNTHPPAPTQHNQAELQRTHIVISTVSGRPFQSSSTLIC
ncbi:hypothetical protein L5G28_18435, partial [Gordonia sp. HY285]|uniref:hypothetical protein n=1 Tax=Gordonia liuliyuniae TaxID=2911517 RepID=UPI001F1C103C